MSDSGNEMAIATTAPRTSAGSISLVDIDPGTISGTGGSFVGLPLELMTGGVSSVGEMAQRSQVPIYFSDDATALLHDMSAMQYVRELCRQLDGAAVMQHVPTSRFDIFTTTRPDTKRPVLQIRQRVTVDDAGIGRLWDILATEVEDWIRSLPTTQRGYFESNLAFLPAW